MGRPKRVTIRDVAKAAAVSITTVSDALNGKGRLPAATRDRVVAVAAGLGYHASPNARRLRQGRTGAIGLYLPDRASGLDYYMNVALGAADAAFARDLTLTLMPIRPDARQKISADLLDGLIVVDPMLTDPVLDTLAGLDVPIVSCERDLGSPVRFAGVVTADNRAAVHELLGHLARRGATTIGLLGLAGDTAFGSDVHAAYLDWCAARGQPPLISQTPFVDSAESRYQAADRLLNDHPEIDAVVSAPEGGALGILQAAERHGIRVPEDMLIASCVDHSSLWSAKPPITAIDLNPRLMGRYGAELLADLLEGRAAAPVTRALPTRLVERDSTLPRAPR
ncbi:LacI family DNA-binding transcriptional regulator [Nonomuraea sp. NPDC050547]|uniref:LacI family DNA-binding transcriptional regulator n=1 Tax=unclassified Nonomuraea TaxID=2593643 RepID=UPI003794522B